VKVLKVAGQSLNDLVLEASIGGLHSPSVRALLEIGKASCGFNNMTADESQRVRKAVETLLTSGMSIGIPALKGSGEGGQVSASLMLELMPASDGKITLEKHLRSSGQLTITGTLLNPSQIDMALTSGFAEKVPGGYIVHGQKVWTSTAQVANKIMLLTRTTKLENCKKPTEGITIFYTDLDRSKIEVHKIPKMGRKCVDSNAIFIDGLFIPDEDRIGEEGKGFSYILHSLNPERLLVAAEAIAIGQDALRRGTQYARDRVVFDRPIGQNQGIQHPLAERWMNLEAAWTMVMKGAWLYDNHQPCGAEANTAKFLGARAGFEACLQSVLTHGGFGYAKEYHVERLLREVTVTRIAPITEQLILSYIAEKVLDLPKSY
jgi:hypothetical protein